MVNLAPYIAQCAKRTIDSKLRCTTGMKIYCDPDYIEHDGRKRKAVVKELQALGYIGLQEDCPSSTRSFRCEIKNKAYNELHAIPVNLITHWTEQRKQTHRRVLRGVMLRTLSDQEVKYLIENKDHYTFYICKLRDFMNGCGEPIMEKFVPGTDVYEAVLKGWTDEKHCRYPETEIVVCDDALAAHIDNILWNETLEDAMNGNLAWGLVKLGIFPEAGKVVSVNDVPMILGSNDMTAVFPQDYTKWAETLPERIDQTQKRLQNVEAKLRNLLALSANMQGYGGWDKFLADYRVAVEASLKAKEEKKEKVA